MDERQVQVDRRSGGQRGPCEFHPAASRGLEMAGTHEHEMLLAQGHYRCSHCRRADINEMNAAARRMR
jgi:hypothetical protein